VAAKAKTLFSVAVNDTYRLQIGINGSGAEESHAAFLEICGDVIGKRRCSAFGVFLKYRFSGGK